MSNIVAAGPDAGLSKYLSEIRKLPVLDREEEFMLAKRWREHHDVEAAHKLVTSHLKLVAKIAMGYRHYGLPLSDLIAEGNVGLMRAVKKFDPDVGVRLATYAMWWIKASLHEYLLNSWSLVRLGTLATQRKLFFNLRRLKARLGILDTGDLSAEDVGTIAAQLDVPAGEVVDMNRRLAGRDASLNAPLTIDGDGQVQDLLLDESADQEAVVAERQEWRMRRMALKDGLKALNERERDIVTRRHLVETPATLEEIGQDYGISRERVRQIEARAIAKLTEATRAAAA